MNSVDVVVLSDGALMILMGVLGFARKHSVPSLVAGVAIGVLLIATVAVAKKNPRVGRIAAAVVALLPLGQFLKEFLKAPALYPSGIICAGSLFTFGFLLASHFAATSRRRQA